MRQPRRNFGAGARTASRVRVRMAPAFALLACMISAPRAAQEAGAQVIRGVVVDSTSQVRLSNVRVFLTDSSNREVEDRLVDTSGEFEFIVPGPGWYALRAERTEMATKTVERIDVAAGDTVSLTLELARLSTAALLAELAKSLDLEGRPPVREDIDLDGRDQARARIVFDEDGGVIVGEIQGEGEGVARSGARVGLVGLGEAFDVDPEGRFVIPGLPEGTFRLAYLHPRMDGLDWEYPLADVAVQFGDTTTVTLLPAHPHQVLAQACGLEAWKAYTGVLHGQVVVSGSGSPAPGITVTARWHETRSRNPRDGSGMAMNAVSVTNEDGVFRFCAIPTDFTRVEVTAGEYENQATGNATLSDDRPVMQITLELPRM